MGDCCGFLRTWLPCICCCFVEYPYKVVDQSFEGMFERFGRYVKTVKPGLQYVNPCTDKLKLVDMKIKVMDLAQQTVMTKDNITIIIDASVYYRVTNSRYATYRV